MASTRQLSRIKATLESEVTPCRATLLHLAIIGLPVCWGLIPLWDSSIHPWMGFKFLKNLLPSSSSIFNEQILSAGGTFSSSLEAFSVQDMGWHFIYPYELSFVAWFILRSSKGEMHFFHRTLTMCSFATVLFMSLLQCVHPTKSFAPFESNFFARMVLCHLLAISMSTWTMSLSSTVGARPSPDCAAVARWSIPGMALFVGSMTSALVVVASIQALVEEHGLENYFGVDAVVSQIVITSFLLGVYYLAVHAFLLYRLQSDLMTVKQLKSLCLYKVILHLFVALLWMPELDPVMHVDKRVTIGLRLALALIYGFGYNFAGAGDNVGRILAGEKSD